MANLNRLQHLNDILVEVNKKRKKFDMGVFVQMNECGTAACAFGYCALDPKFKRQGLKLVPDECDYGDGYLDVQYKGKVKFEAATEFFDITVEEAEYLFGPLAYALESEHIRPPMVRKRVVELMKKYATQSA